MKRFVKGNKRGGRLLKYTKAIANQKRKIAWIFLISLLVSAVNIGGSALCEYLADEVSSSYGLRNGAPMTEGVSSGLHSINGICITILMIYIVLMIAQFVRNIIMAYLVRNVDLSISSSYFEKLCSLPQEFFERYKTGALMSRFDDVSSIRDAVSNAALSAMLDIFIPIITGVYLLFLNRSLFLICLITIGMYALVMFVFRPPVKKSTRNLWNRTRKLRLP